MTTETTPRVGLPSSDDLSRWESEFRRCPNAPESIAETASLRKLVNGCRQLESVAAFFREHGDALLVVGTGGRSVNKQGNEALAALLRSLGLDKETR